MTKEKNEQMPGKPFLIAFGIVVLALFVWLLLVIIHVPYSETEYYYIKEPYQTTVTDHYVRNVKYCNVDSDCYCIHRNFWGTCDRCQCERERTITKYRDVQKSRTVTKYCNLWKRIAGWC